MRKSEQLLCAGPFATIRHFFSLCTFQSSVWLPHQKSSSVPCEAGSYRESKAPERKHLVIIPWLGSPDPPPCPPPGHF